MAPVADSFIKQLFEVEHNYIRLRMCAPASCPCSSLIDPSSAAFAARYQEFGHLDVSGENGDASAFYGDCYLPAVARGELRPLHPRMLDLLYLLEREGDCAGLCEPSLFYFFKSARYGPPPRSCRAEILNYYRWEWAVVTYFGIFHGTVLLLYFMV